MGPTSPPQGSSSPELPLLAKASRWTTALCLAHLLSSLSVPGSAEAQTAPPTTQPISQTQNAGLRIEAPASIQIEPGDAIPFLFSATRSVTSSVAVGPFIESTRHQSLQSEPCFQLQIGGRCQPMITVGANSFQRAWLSIPGSPEGGRYAGNIRLLTPAGERVDHQIVIDVRDGFWRAIGAAALAVGILLSFLLAVWVPHSRDRERTLRQFLLLRARAEQAESLLPPGVPDLRSRIEELRAATEPTRLAAESLVPGVIPGTGTAAAEVERRNAELARLERVVAAIEILTRAIRRESPTEHGILDAIAGATDFPQADINAEIDQALGNAANARGAGIGASEFAVQRLIFREEVRNGAYWIVSSVVTALLGYVLLIDADPSFSGWSDVAATFFWGLGLATAGSKLGDLTPGQLRTALRGTST
jgi:hypothetical protein